MADSRLQVCSIRAKPQLTAFAGVAGERITPNHLQIVRLHKLLDDAHARIVRVEADAEQLRSELALSLLGQPTVSMPRHAELIGRSVSAAAALGVLLYCTGSTQ